MAVTLTVQNDAGTVALANGYVTVAEFKAYHDDRGNSYAGKTDDQIKVGIIRATDHIDTVNDFKGAPLTDDQTTQFPREGINDQRGNEYEGIPTNVKKATSEYAMRALAAPLIPDADEPTASGIKRVRSKVDVIEDEVEYQDGAGPGSRLPAYPAADLFLRPFVSSGSGGGKIVR
jgi:hypothetical protein